MIIASFILLNCYIIVLFFLYKGFQRLIEIPSSEILKNKVSEISFTIVIPFRNEENHLENLVASLNSLKFPKEHFEIIFVNDDSTDTSTSIIKKNINKEISYIILENIISTNSPKKDAITLAISKAKGSWIVTTDADCEIPKTWLSEYAKAIEAFDPKMLCAPVKLNTNNTLLDSYQIADFISLQGVTMGSFGVGNAIMCNGANLAFEKQAFYTVNGYDGNTHLASGDDIFMLQKMNLKFPGRVHFIKSIKAIVTTKPATSWQALFRQRIRWASKTSKVKNTNAKALGLLVFLVNFLALISIILFFLNSVYLVPALVYLLLKITADTLFILKIKKWMLIGISFHSLIISGFLYPFITVYVAIKSVFSNYNWKGRSY